MARYSLTFPASFRFSDIEDREEFRERVTRLMTELCVGQYEFNKIVYEYGLERIEEDLAEKGKLSPLKSAIVEMRKVQQREDDMFRDMHYLSEKMGRDQFIAWYMDQPGCDLEVLNRFIEKEDQYYAGLPWSQRARHWIFKELSDGNPHNTDDIKHKAYEEGIIENFDNDWVNLRQIATRSGVSGGEKGEWRLPPYSD